MDASDPETAVDLARSPSQTGRRLSAGRWLQSGSPSTGFLSRGSDVIQVSGSIAAQEQQFREEMRMHEEQMRDQ
jgi:hypothetical protein